MYYICLIYHFLKNYTEIRVGITSTSYTVDEDAGTLEICVIIRNGSIAPDYTGPDLRVLLRPEIGAPQPEATGKNNNYFKNDKIYCHVSFVHTCT